MRRVYAAAFAAVLLLQSSGSAYGASRAVAPNLEISIPRALGITIAQDWLASHAAIMALIQTRSQRQSSPPDFRNVKKGVPLDPSVMRATQRIKPTFTGSGTRLQGPQMLSRPLSPQASKRLAPSVVRTLSGTRPAQTRSTATRSIRTMTVTIGSTNTTGINHWWTYEEGGVPGIGKYMVNVANGNLIVQANDIDVPERGIDLAFRRTYNSMSTRDWNSGYSDDGSPTPGMYGNGWTNTFDAHIAGNSSGGISVFDIDGARYDYTPSGGCLTPPAGQYATLCTDGGTGYLWTKKTGTIYYFYGPTLSGGSAAYAGRLNRIWARNHNNNIVFVYSWVNGDASTSLNLTQIQAQHSDGHTLTLNFGSINGIRLLSSLVRPDGATVSYTYDSSNRLTSVYQIPNNAAGTQPLEGYGWNTGSQMQWASSPRWNNSGATDGGYINFGFNPSNQIAQVNHVGIVNFVPNDGTGTQLQPGYSTSGTSFRAENFSYPASETQLSDTDGHATNWFYDGVGHVTQTQEWTGAPNSLWLTTYASWDSSNNVTETIDARGNPTDYGHDGNGNTIWMQQPTVQTSMGSGRPLARYTYDQYNNLIAYCDPQYVWTTGAQSCPATSGTTHYTWNSSDSNEPYGYLTDTYTPLGYHRWISYSTGAQGGDYGLPTDVNSDCISQVDGTSRCSHQSISYDQYGNPASYNTGVGNWALTYDSINRLTTRKDPDAYTSYTYYYANGQVSKTETPYQHTTGTGTTVAYDIDGNESQQTVYRGGSYNSSGPPTLPPAPQPTQKFYDGADRLIEVQQPRDPNGIGEAYTNPWITRYLYDLSQDHTNGTPTINAQSVWAYGNLYKTEELVPTADIVAFTSTTAIVNGIFHEEKGNAFDALDRPTARYYFVVNSGQNADTLQSETLTYDSANPISSNNAGESSSDCNGLSQCAYYSYDNDGALSRTSHTADTSLDRTLTYDPDGRAVTTTQPSLGNWTASYDADGRLVQSVEPAGMGSPATLTYDYYADGTRSALDVSSYELTQASLFAYAYRDDGKLQSQQINVPSNALVGTTTLTFTYSAAGRLQQRSESGTGANPTPVQYAYDATYGYLTEVDYPGGKDAGLEYDPMGAMLGQNATATGSSITYASTYTYTPRGEMRTTTQFTQGPEPVNVMANGVAVNTNYKSATKTTSSWQVSVDPRMGVVLGSDVSYSDGSGNSQSAAFDALGRATSDDVSSSCATSNDKCLGSDQTNTRTYDQDNHILSDVASDQNGNTTTATYTWGANGHPVAIAATCLAAVTTCGPVGAVSTETLHWAGNQLLFTTHGNVLDDIKIGEIGDITPQDSTYKGLTFWDRDASSAVVFCHNASGAGGSGKPAYTYASLTGTQRTMGPCGPASMLWSSGSGYVRSGSTYLIGWGGVLAMPRGDGFLDGFNQVQGVRIYDPAVNAWATPDAYQGNVHDPMSQKSYVWNRNNPAAYGDPTGFTAQMFFDPSVGDGNVSISWAEADGSYLNMYDAGDIVALVGEPYKISWGASYLQSYGQSAVYQQLLAMEGDPSGHNSDAEFINGVILQLQSVLRAADGWRYSTDGSYRSLTVSQDKTTLSISVASSGIRVSTIWQNRKYFFKSEMRFAWSRNRNVKDPTVQWRGPWNSWQWIPFAQSSEERFHGAN